MTPLRLLHLLVGRPPPYASRDAQHALAYELGPLRAPDQQHAPYYRACANTDRPGHIEPLRKHSIPKIASDQQSNWPPWYGGQRDRIEHACRLVDAHHKGDERHEGTNGRGDSARLWTEPRPYDAAHPTTKDQGKTTSPGRDAAADTTSPTDMASPATQKMTSIATKLTAPTAVARITSPFSCPPNTGDQLQSPTQRRWRGGGERERRTPFRVGDDTGAFP